jgi:hypothetical protein
MKYASQNAGAESVILVDGGPMGHDSNGCHATAGRLTYL